MNDSVQNDPEVTKPSFEDRAAEKGWVPEEEWSGEPDQWRPAKEFVERGELMDRISSQTKQINRYSGEVEELKTGMKALAEHNKKVAELEYKKAMADLKRQKAEALDLGDHGTVVDIDEQMSELKETKQTAESTPTPSSQQQAAPDPALEAWMSENSWYNNDVILQGAADALARQYVATNPGSEGTPSVVLNYVSSAIKQEFPEKFGLGKRRPAATTEPSTAGGASGKKGSKKTVAHLDPEQKVIAKRFAATGVMTEQEYVDQLAELGEIK